MDPTADHSLLYDADCGFCTRMLRRVMRLDRRRRLRPVAIQSAEGERLLAGMSEAERLASWHLVEPDGTVHSAGAAAPVLARLLPGGRGPAALLAAFPRVTDRAYRWVADNRDRLGRVLVLFAAVALAGCGSSVQEGSELTVYLSGPERGIGAKEWRDIVDGSALAHAEAGGEAGGVPVRVVELDDSGPGGDGPRWTQPRVADNARRAVEDSTSIGYIGELEPDATRISIPITNDAGLLQLAPLAEEDMLREEAGSNDVPPQLQTSGERSFGALLVGSARGAPEPDPAFLRDFEAETGRWPGLSAALGYEAMALVLDSVARASDPLDRGAVIEAFLATSGRDSILGTYSIDPVGAASIGGG